MESTGFLGPWGTFCQEAACEYNKSGAMFHPYSSIEKVFEAVERGEVYQGIVPIENSIEGSVNLTLDLLTQDTGLKIKGEIVLRIRQNLMANNGITITQIKRVYSHPQAIFQCRDFLNRFLPQTDIHHVGSTAEGALRLREDTLGAVIGSRKLVELYNLKLLKQNIQSHKNNFTRFVVVALSDRKPTGDDKTSMVFSVSNTPGSLLRVLKEFAERDLNLTKIESRPSKKRLGQYIFYLDVEGHRKDLKLRHALEKIRKKCGCFKVLGSYPKYKINTGGKTNDYCDGKKSYKTKC